MRDRSEAIINHFSHEHPLHLANPQPSRTCSACKKTLETEPLYTCKSTSCTTFSLHLNCTQLPRRITHPCHQNHPLTLISKPHNPSGGFTCNACGSHGDGFAYSCKDCGISIHTVCAKLPLSLSHMSHFHQLGLVFSSPYPTNGFSCDLCGVIEGRKCWLYRCGSCGFDAHLSCATSKVQVVNRAAYNHNNLSWNQINDQRNQFLQRPAMSYSGGNMNSQIQQAIMGGGGGGSSINNRILQALMGGGGCGGGVSNQLLQAFMGGGGGDLIQGLLNGSNGGVGGLDLSSVLGNVGDFGGLMGGFGDLDFS